MRRDTLVAALCEAGLLSVIGLLGYLVHSPLIFTSLGPTAYELVETPARPSARTYNILVGHAVGIASGIIALGVTHAWAVPVVSVHSVPLLRVLSVGLAGLLTVVGTLVVRATQPAALSTTLLIALGTMQSWQAILSILAGVVIMAAIGVPIRRARTRAANA